MQQYDFPNKPNLDNINISPRLIIYALGAFILLWVASGIYIVNPEEQAVVLRFGKATGISQSGIHYHLPRPIESIEKEKVTQVKRIEIGFRTISMDPAPRYQKVLRESEMITGDENIVDVELIVQFRISSLMDYLFNVAGQAEAVRGVSESALRQVIGRHTIDEGLTEGKLLIQQEIAEEIRSVFELYGMGVRLQNVKLQAVSVPREVDPAFKDVASAREDRERLKNEAEAYQNEIIPRARGEAQKQIRGAEAYTVERVKRSQGDAERFLSVLKEYRNAREVTEKRLYLETMEKILPKIQKYIVQSDGKGGLLNVLNLPAQRKTGGTP
jgi:membrane protease subunit HflK